MKPIQTEDVQPLLLAMLKAFNLFATRNNIEYFVAGGTLLGTIRHKGFIPWDDDIDLFVKEDMATKILKLTKNNPYIDDEGRYKILAPAVKPNVYPTIKLVDTKTVVYEQNISKKYACGIWIDIFKMAYWPNDYNESLKLFDEQKKIKKWLQLSIFGNLQDFKYKVAAPFATIGKGILLLSGKNCEYWSKRLYQLGENEKTKYIGNLSWSSTIKDRYPSEWYDSVVEMPFEDIMVPVPSEYDKILTQFYNDYMKLPPVDKRIRHDFEAYYV